RLGVEPPAAPITYFFYPTPEELQTEIAQRDGIHVSGLTEFNSHSGETIIRTGYPGHAHEVVHALLYTVNPDPSFFVSEACATIFGACWGTEEDIMNGAALITDSDVRVVNAAGEEVDVEACLVYDDKGLWVGPLRLQRS